MIEQSSLEQMIAEAEKRDKENPVTVCDTTNQEDCEACGS